MAPENFSLWVFHLRQKGVTNYERTLTEFDHLESLGLSLGEAFEEAGSVHGGCRRPPPPSGEA